MAELFDAYHEEFSSQSKVCREKISSASKQSEYSEIDEMLKELQSTLKQLEVQCADTRGAQKVECSAKVSAAKNTIIDLKSEVKQSRFKHEKASLTGGKSAGDRARMIDANSRLVEQNRTVERLVTTVLSTEETASETATNLRENTEKIKSSQSKAEEAVSIMDQADKATKRMNRRTWTLGLF